MTIAKQQVRGLGYVLWSLSNPPASVSRVLGFLACIPHLTSFYFRINPMINFFISHSPIRGTKEARTWEELGFLGWCPSSDLYLMCVILNNAINFSASQILYFQNWDNTTYADYIIIELMWRHVGEWSLNKKCIHRMQMTDLSVSGLTDVLRTWFPVRLDLHSPKERMLLLVQGLLSDFSQLSPIPVLSGVIFDDIFSLGWLPVTGWN